jgi:hypothetical protein
MTAAVKGSGVEQMHPCPSIVKVMNSKCSYYSRVCRLMCKCVIMKTGVFLQDTIIGLMLNLRVTSTVMDYENAVNGRYLDFVDDKTRKPWQASSADIDILDKVLEGLVWLIPNHIAGTRFLHILNTHKPKKLSHYNVLGGPIGEHN